MERINFKSISFLSSPRKRESGVVCLSKSTGSQIKPGMTGVGVIFLILVFFALGFFVSATELININTASLEELDTLPGIGQSKAQAIIDYRELNGNFSEIEDVMNVSGIGQTTFDNIKNLITVENGGSSNSSEINIVINELLPNPEGSDDAEWIELKNLSDSSVNLENWKISDTSKSYTLPNISISANGFLILEKSDTGISLNNSNGETVSLFDADESLIDSVNYSETAEENYSYARKSDGNYTWTNILTKNYENEFESEAQDEESSEQTSGGSSTGQTSEEGGSVYKGRIIISEILPNPIGIDDGFTEWIEIYNSSSQKIYLNNWKLVDNQTEYNFGIQKIDARSWLVLRRQTTNLILNNSNDEIILYDNLRKKVDSVNYTKTFEAKSYSWCNEQEWMWLDEVSVNAQNNCPVENELPQAYFELSPNQVNLGQEIILNAQETYDPDGEIINYTWEFNSEISSNDFKIEKNNNKFLISTTTPIIKIKFLQAYEKETINLFTRDNLGGEDKYSQQIKILNAKKHNNKNSDETQINPDIKKYNLSDLKTIKNLPKGSFVSVNGQVAVEPGILSSNIFYITDNLGNGIQIYSYYKDFPGLTLGDQIQVSGEIGEAYNEKRIKINSAQNIVIIESANPPEPLQTTLDRVGEDLEGSLVQVSGEITAIETAYDYFWLDDGNGEIKILIKPTTAISLENLGLNVGNQTTLTGIFSQTTSGYRILPRYESDILVGEVRGVENKNIETKKTNNLLNYLLSILIAGIIILGILYFKKKK